MKPREAPSKLHSGMKIEQAEAPAQPPACTSLRQTGVEHSEASVVCLLRLAGARRIGAGPLLQASVWWRSARGVEPRTVMTRHTPRMVSQMWANIWRRWSQVRKSKDKRAARFA